MNAIEHASSLVVHEESPPPPYNIDKEDDHHRGYRRKRRWSFTSLFQRIKKRQRQQQQPYIRTIITSGPTGDVLDREQQQDVLNKFFAHPQAPLQSHTPIGPEASKVASLEFIWVFRLKSVSSPETPVWTTFDIANQALLTQYKTYTKAIEIFDSHIRQGKLPVLVVPGHHLGYFPLDMTGDAIATLEITCLPNSNGLGFVYRKTPRHPH